MESVSETAIAFVMLLGGRSSISVVPLELIIWEGPHHLPPTSVPVTSLPYIDMQMK